MELIYPALAVIISLVLFIILLAALLIGRVTQRKQKEDKTRLFGSTVKVPQSPSSFPIAVKVQPSPTGTVLSSWDGSETNLEKAAAGKGSPPRGLSRSDEKPTFDNGHPPAISWKLWFKIEYLPKHQNLVVTIFRAKSDQASYETPLQSTSRYAFVSLYLLPEELVKHTGLYSNNGSPSFDEEFSFQVKQSKLSGKQLRLSLYDMDSSRTRNCLGHTVVKLNELSGLEEGTVQYMNRDMCDLDKVGGPAPEVHVSLCFDTRKEKLKLQIFAARNLPEMPAGMRYYLRTNVIVGTKSAKVKKSAVCNSLYGVLQCSYAFQVPLKHIDSCCLQFSIIQIEPKSGHESLLASFVIGPCMYAHGVGMDHWKQMMANTRKTVEMWHRLVFEQGIEP